MGRNRFPIKACWWFYYYKIAHFPDTGACWLLKFITEHGRRPHPRSTTISTVRFHARKYAALEKHRRDNPTKGRHIPPRGIQKAPEIPRDTFRSISPRTILGAGRVDPFNSFPVKADPYVHELFDHSTSFILLAQEADNGVESRKNTQLMLEFCYRYLRGSKTQDNLGWWKRKTGQLT